GVVGLTVAVVVDAVADLGRGSDGALADDASADARGVALLARADAAAARHAAEAVIGEAIAVVIEPIARLRHRPDGLHAGEPAGPRPRSPGALVCRAAGAGGVDARAAARSAQAAEVVDHSVAVVVDGVAGLRRFGHRAHAGLRAASALVRP